MFCITPTNKIILTRGDNAEIDVRLYNKEGSEDEILPSDHIILTLKKVLSEPAVLVKTAELNSIFIEPADTAQLAPGLFYYDIQLVRDDEVQTILPCNTFELLQEVG